MRLLALTLCFGLGCLIFAGCSSNPIETTAADLLNDFDVQDIYSLAQMVDYYSEKPLAVRMVPDSITPEGDRLVLRQDVASGILYASISSKDAGRVSAKSKVTVVGTIERCTRGEVNLGLCSIK